jgi:hypothetical protein
VQAICDRIMKRFIWASGMHKGSLHDSVAFGDTTLMTRMTSMAAKLKEHGFFIGADSAYPLLSFVMVPYINLINKQQDPSFKVGAAGAEVRARPSTAFQKRFTRNKCGDVCTRNKYDEFGNTSLSQAGIMIK